MPTSRFDPPRFDECHAPYVIAELASAHEGDFDFARGCVDVAASAGADAIKFQIFGADALVVPTHPRREAYLNLQLTEAQWVDLARRARDEGLDVLVDAFEPWSLEMAAALDAAAVKVHSTNVTNPFFLDRVGALGKAVLLGVGGTHVDEVGAAVDRLKARDVPIILQHGFQGFPTATADTHLRRIVSLRERFDLPVGLAGHADGGGDGNLNQNLIALGLGCRLFENHITLDRSTTRTDYTAAMLPDTFAAMVAQLRDAHDALGSDTFDLPEAELKYRATFKAYIVAARDLPAGHTLMADDFAFKRADGGLLPTQADQLIGRALSHDVPKDKPITRHDVA